MAGPAALQQPNDEEEFFDVPDEVRSIAVASRGCADITLQWSAPCDNARAIERYQIFAQRWQLGEGCGPLPLQEEDGLEGLSVAPPADDILLVSAGAAEVEAEHVGPGICQFCVQAPPSLRRHLEEASCRRALAVEGLPNAAWVAVRAGNCEGWAEWSPPALALLRGRALAPEGAELQTWGLAEDGRLGRGHAALQRGVCAEAGAVEALRGQPLHSLALGSHSAAVTADDRLFVWGTFTAEVLPADAPAVVHGDGRVHDEVDMQVEPAYQPLPVVPHAVSCGRFATLVLSAEGRLFAWGPNEAHQCGIKGAQILRAVVELKIPNRAPVVQVALGEFHGLALTAGGRALVWGMEQGPEVRMRPGCDLGPKLGMLPERAALNQPEPRELDVSGRITGVAAGAYHSALLTEDGRLWIWGSNNHGQLGHGSGVREARLPRPLEAFSGREGGRRAAFVSLGGFHSAAVDTEGRLFTWGDNKRGQCGQGEAAAVETPTPLVLAASTPRCTGLSCGGFFSLFEGREEAEGQAKARQIYACGWGKEGCLGFGQPCKRMLRPRPMPAAPGGRRWAYLRAGMVHVAGLLEVE
uniref:RCC1-like domain-containing protein n=1 Tax=Alexandrium monilatum TaxID=311494 RepID=A0A7S4PS08_9DINO